MRTHHKIQALQLFNKHLTGYLTPVNLNWNWNWGSLAGVMLVSQMLTGVLLAMHYVADVLSAFSSVQHLMSDVPGGMVIRNVHATGASLFFGVVYMHLLRGIYARSGTAPREMVWLTGLALLLGMMGTAFMGYVLPWGQMSFWGATVLTSLATSVAIVGQQLVYVLWGGFSVDNPTLQRFYSVHYALPFLLAGISVIHLASLHQYGSTNPLGVNHDSHAIGFWTYFGVKDLLGVCVLFVLGTVLVFFLPHVFEHPENAIPANPYATPAHIVPEWYFLWVYALLRSIPSKGMGIALILLVFAGVAALCISAPTHCGSGKFRLLSEALFWALVADLCLLTWVGAQPITAATMLHAQIVAVALYLYVLVFVPVVHALESDLC